MEFSSASFYYVVRLSAREAWREDLKAFLASIGVAASECFCRRFSLHRRGLMWVRNQLKALFCVLQGAF